MKRFMSGGLGTAHVIFDLVLLLARRTRVAVSAALRSKSRLLLATYRSRRCGLSSAVRQMRWTASLLKPRSRASLRHDQCVAPSLGGHWLAASTRASSRVS
jgi:hypothetical protein